VLEEILSERVVSSRNRRKVKRKMSKFPLRPNFSKLPPGFDFEKAIVIVK
jgi:hypothetical protein